VTHEELLNAVWGPGYEGDYSVLRVNISRLRQKVENLPRCPNYIITVPRRGYRIPKALSPCPTQKPEPCDRAPV
jgi:two-component system KDP operon response regulator KdpE